MEDSRSVRRRQTALTLVVLGAVIAVVVAGLYLSDPARRLERATATPTVDKQYRTPSAGLDPNEVWIARSESTLQSLQQTHDRLRRDLETLREQVQQLQRRRRQPVRDAAPPPAPNVAPDFGDRTLLNPLAVPASPDPREPKMDRPLPPSPSPVLRPPTDATPRAPQPSIDGPGILVVDLTPIDARLPTPPGSVGALPVSGATPAARTRPRDGTRPRRHVRDFIPAGSFIKAVLLSGLDAPTGGLAKTNPQPVLLRLVNDGALPNGFRARLRACFVTAAGYGDLAAERAYLRLEKLSCVFRDGAVVERPLKGFVAGEDGKAGLRGRLVSKQGRLIARALIAGVAGGIGSGVAQSLTSLSTSALGNVQSVDAGNVSRHGVARGFASALDRIAQWYLERANEVYPVLEVDAGRSVDIVLNEGLALDADPPRAADPGAS